MREVWCVLVIGWLMRDMFVSFFFLFFSMIIDRNERTRARWRRERGHLGR